jgi:zinc D-Ala-D-Ala carboxypeptidase
VKYLLCVKLAEGGQRLSEHFQAGEFACSCCGLVLVHPELVRKLEGLRSAAGAPVNITSGYRCANCNTAVGGAENSCHLFGMAADIWVEGISPRQLAEVAENTGFDGIGIYAEQGFLHVDVRGYRSRWEG